MPAATLDRHNHDDYDDCGDIDDDDVHIRGFPSPLKLESILDFPQKLGLRMWKLSSLYFVLY